MEGHAQGEGAQGHRWLGKAILVASARENVMDIAKVQKSLAAKALYQPQHRFNDLYRYVRIGNGWKQRARTS